ncbi:hypothetical protein GIB67_017450 [Kingdonia uniflora]|uniref:C2H2-type domain-containing protein n=1 Tax=Kingdonia uniflora TaxID=39325 RepID=A0A7J7M4B7_9MAGN|nr:hypothetical protein GIB67_017450 [Kingdonia uniflora]
MSIHDDTSSSAMTGDPITTTKKKRSLPGNPDPDAEVIALSPTTLMATNRFVCEICNKGFQRDQNLQLHRRGHNLPWKLRQRSGKEVRKRVYICPELGCIHHQPNRALGDLTGIKKHFSRKHGEKKWKCEKCGKKYAVQSDWKAHLKTCGTKEYRCDCGTLFARKDSFITHRAFCDALAEESSRVVQMVPSLISAEEQQPKLQIVVAANDSPTPTSPPTPIIISAQIQIQGQELPAKNTGISSCLNGSSSMSSSNGNGTSMFANLFSSSSTMAGELQRQQQQQQQQQHTSFADLINAMARSERSMTNVEPISLCLSSSNGSSLQYAAPFQPALSATALLQKAAEMSAATTNASLLRGLGVSLSSNTSSGQQQHQQENVHWNRLMESEGSGGIGELIMGGGSSSMFGSKPTTLDFLGLGMGVGGGSGAAKGGFSALLNSIGDRLDVAAGTWGDGNYSEQRKS